jgi:hypothetical protein
MPPLQRADEAWPLPELQVFLCMRCGEVATLDKYQKPAGGADGFGVATIGGERRQIITRHGQRGIGGIAVRLAILVAR